MKKYGTPVLVLVLVVAGALAGLSSLSRPKVLPASGPATEFSAERAMAHVSSLAQAPHPPGSDEIERVRAAILAQLEAMGLEPEVQESTIVEPWGSAVIGSTIKNIVVKLPGSDSSQALLLDAHYDTRAMTPGASDCSSCVAILLETARALQASPPLQNDVILVFTDNEEYGGGLGASALIEANPWIDEVGLVLNFEGLGSTGPSILFETGPGSGWALRDWAQVASFPVGQSWFEDIYSRTPIGTDMNWYADRGTPGLNFGFWANGPVYHSALDNPETLDPRSVQHQGETALALARHFGNQDMGEGRGLGGDMIYFSLVRGLLIRYPSTWAMPLAVGLGLLLVGLGVAGVRSKQLTVRGMLKGLGACVASVVVSSGLATGLWMGATQLHGEYQAMLTFRGMVYNAYLYLFAFAALAVAVAAAFLVLFRRKTAVMDMTFGAFLFWWLLAFATGIFFSGFSYLFTWPLLFCALAMGWVFWLTARGRGLTQTEIVWAVGTLPAVILLIPSIYVMYHFALAPMIGILAFMVALLLGLLIPQLDLLTRARPWRLSTVALATCAGFLVAGSLTARFTADRPRPNAVAYLLDADSGEATWFSGGAQLDDWTGQFFETEPERGTVGELFPIAQRSGFPVMRGDAPTIAQEGPQVDLLDDRIADGVRTLQLRVSSSRGAPVLMLDVEPYGAVQAATVEGKRLETVESARRLWSLTYYAVPTGGIDVTLELDPSQPITLQISDQTWELVPEVVEGLSTAFRPRTDAMMPMPNFDYGTVVVRTVRVE